MHPLAQVARFFPAIAPIGLVLLTHLAIGADSSAPHVWQRWEHSFTSSVERANPYADVTVQVRYTSPGGRTIRTYGFWDGGKTFRIRCAFPETGNWRWETECSDPADGGLHRRSGTVNVVPYRGANPLYQHGFLKVSTDRRYLTYGDDTPYLWMGDTAWSVPYRATDREWDTYIADRVAKRFSLFQITTPPRWGPANFKDEPPFSNDTLTQWTPSFWQSVDRRIQSANEAGLMIFYVGLMEPVKRYPDSPAACLFARNLVARLFGNFVIFSPSFDSRPNPLAHEVGRATRDATTVHLITQHPGTGGGTPLPNFALYHADQPYMDFVGVQSGHNNGNRENCARQSIDWVLHLYQRQPRLPVINVEAMYDGHGEKAWQAVDARGLGWRSWLSGAMGYTYGAGDVAPKVPKGSGGVWRWVSDPASYDHWEKALQWESATQMKHLAEFLSTIDWWRLEPAHDLIRNQPPEALRRTVLATLPGRSRAVAYLPDRESIEIDLSVFPSTLTARWFDPVRGVSTPMPGAISNRGTHVFTAPADGDWVLVLASSGSK